MVGIKCFSNVAFFTSLSAVLYSCTCHSVMHCKCCLHFGTINYYLCQGGYGFAGVCLSVSKHYSKAISRLWWNFQYRSCGWCTFLFVFWWHYFKSCWWILMTFSGSSGNATRNSVEVVVIIRKTEMNCLGRSLCSLSAFLCHLIHHNSTFYIWVILVYVHAIDVKYKLPYLMVDTSPFISRATSSGVLFKFTRIQNSFCTRKHQQQQKRVYGFLHI